MRAWILILSFVLVAIAPPNAHAQLLEAPDSGGGLKLTLEPIRLHGTLPVRFTVVLTNISNHDLHLPQPHLECGDVATGSIFLYARFLPGSSAPLKPHTGCIVDEFHVPIPQRLRSWNVLPAGQSLRFDMDLTNAEPNAPAPGTYTIWAGYDPPAVSPDELKLVEQNGLAVPTSRLATVPLEYHVPAN